MSVPGWTGRIDAEDGFDGMRWHQSIRHWTPSAQGGVAFVGFCSDEGVRRNQGRVGAAEGPSALRAMLANLPCERSWKLFDAGNVSYPSAALESGQQHYAERIAAVIRQGQMPVGLGGGHEIAWGSFVGLAESGLLKPNQTVGVLNFDAHFDLRKYPPATSGTSFTQMFALRPALGVLLQYRVMGISQSSNTRALFETAKSLGAEWRFDHELTIADDTDVVEDLQGWLASLDHLYLSICLDVMPSYEAPGVSAPSARGVTLGLLESLAWAAAASGKLRLADVAELCPRLDIDNRTARSAARLIWRIVSTVQASGPGKTP